MNNIEQWLEKFNLFIPKKVTSPLPNNYRPELDVSE